MQATAGLATLTALFMLLRMLVEITEDGRFLDTLSALVAAFGVFVAAAALAFYAAKESFLKHA